jgi:hypothetical protein
MAEREGTPETLSVYQLIMVMVDQMSAVAWQKLGLQADPLTGRVSTDLEQARVAIDVTAGLAGFLEPELDDEDKRRIHGLVRDLKINYLQRAKEGNAS